MKKLLLFVIILLAVTGVTFAQNFTVESVTGQAQRESGNNRVDLKPGDIITADTTVHTSANSALVLKQGNRTINIPASRSGKVSDLASARGLRRGQNTSRTDTDAAERVSGQSATASARAGDAANMPTIAEEDVE